MIRHRTISPECYLIAGKGKRPNGLIIKLQSIDGIEVTLEAPEYENPIKYRFLTRGGHEFELDDPEEVAAAQLILRQHVVDTGAVTNYV